MKYNTCRSSLFLIGTLFLTSACTVLSFVLPQASSSSASSVAQQRSIDNALMMTAANNNEETSKISRRSFFTSTTASAFLLSSNLLLPTTTTTNIIQSANAADEEPTVQTPLYFILRVKEATEQETRLIKSGKFKDVQRANVKLAVKFMLDNYRLNDNFIAASAYLGGDRKIKAVNIGQTTVQNLQTILEYFDSSDVENIKVGSTGLGGKESFVLNGLASAKKGIEDFVSLFPTDDIAAVIAKIEDENELNRKEFDSELGSILNPKPAAQS